MKKSVEIEKHTMEKDAAPAALEVAHSASVRDKHLAGLSEDEKKMIRLMAEIFVKSILRMSEK